MFSGKKYDTLDYEDKLMPEIHALLIVEDEPELNKIISEILQPEVQKIYSAKDGVEAVELLGSHPEICAVLSDINMPRMNGLELLKTLRSKFNPIPFVVLTAYGNPKSMREAIQLNATDFLDKPFSTEELIQVVKRAMAYGVEIQKIEKEITEKYKNSSDQNVEFLKRVKRTTLNMRAENLIYVKEKK
jgi:CheY-like chemotaxis protein